MLYPSTLLIFKNRALTIFSLRSAQQFDPFPVVLAQCTLDLDCEHPRIFKPVSGLEVLLLTLYEGCVCACLHTKNRLLA